MLDERASSSAPDERSENSRGDLHPVVRLLEGPRGTVDRRLVMLRGDPSGASHYRSCQGKGEGEIQPFRLPLAGEPLRLGNLCCCHLRGDEVAIPD
jgi:hypothetical protein